MHMDHMVEIMNRWYTVTDCTRFNPFPAPVPGIRDLESPSENLIETRFA